MLIGEIEGTVSTSGFKFRAYSDIKKFDFVTVKKDEKWILGQVQEVWKYDDGKTEAEVAIIGYKEKGLLKKPRQVIKPNSMVYLADEDIIALTLGLDKKGLYLGKLESNVHVKINLVPESLYKHLAIVAQTGAGKSYLTSVVIEELLEQRVPLLILDPHGEYSSLSIPNDIDKEAATKFEISPSKYPIQQYTLDTETNPDAEKLSFSDEDLEPSEISQVLPTKLTNSQLGTLYTSIKSLGHGYSLENLIKAVMESESKAKWSLVNMLELLEKSGLFASDYVELSSLVKPGIASIINFKGVDPSIQEAAVYLLCKELFEMRKKSKIPPMILVVEEAHNYIPEANIGKATSSGILRTIASEGRKFGFGLIVVSQRPARIDNNILSQCNSQIIMRLTNPNDLNAVSRSFEGITNSVKKTISGLPSGIGVVLGKDYPIITEIRTRKTRHGGETQTGAVKSVSKSVKKESPALQVLSSSKSKPKDENLKEVFYPLWRVSSADRLILVDARDGTVKYRRPELSKTEEMVVASLGSGDKSPSELVEITGMDRAALQKLVQGLIGKKMVITNRSSSGIVISSSKVPYEASLTSVRPSGAKILEMSFSSSDALKVAQGHGIDGSSQLIYYPYFASKTKVYDGITGEEV